LLDFHNFHKYNIRMTEYLSTQEAASRLQVSAETIRRMISEGIFPHARKQRPEKRTSPYQIPLANILSYEQSQGITHKEDDA
jgi:transposase